MPYASPFYLLDLPEEELGSIDARVINRARKRLLAEFELSQEPVISIHGRDYDKAQALKQLDELTEPDSIRYHFFIFKHKELRDFLEDKGYKDFIESALPWQPEFKENAFLDFMAPWFAPQWGIYMKDALKRQSPERVDKLSALSSLIPASHLDSAFTTPWRYLNEQLNQFGEGVDNAHPAVYSSGQFEIYLDREKLICLNQLPEYFQGIRDRYAIQIRDLAMFEFNKASRHKMALATLEVAFKLKCSEETLDQLEHMKGEMTRILGSGRAPRNAAATETTNTGTSNRRVGWIIVASIIFIFRFFSCINSFNKNSNVPVSYNSPGLPYATSQSLREAGVENVVNFRMVFLEAMQSYYSPSKPEDVVFRSIDRNQPEHINFGAGAHPYPDVYMAAYEELVEKMDSIKAFRAPDKAASIIINNSSSWDAIVFLEDEEAKFIKNWYVPAKSSWTIKTMKIGRCKLRVYCGRDWNPRILFYKTTTEDSGGVSNGVIRNAEPVRGAFRQRPKDCLDHLLSPSSIKLKNNDLYIKQGDSNLVRHYIFNLNISDNGKSVLITYPLLEGELVTAKESSQKQDTLITN